MAFLASGVWQTMGIKASRTGSGSIFLRNSSREADENPGAVSGSTAVLVTTMCELVPGSPDSIRFFAPNEKENSEVAICKRIERFFVILLTFQEMGKNI